MILAIIPHSEKLVGFISQDRQDPGFATITNNSYFSADECNRNSLLTLSAGLSSGWLRPLLLWGTGSQGEEKYQLLNSLAHKTHFLVITILWSWLHGPGLPTAAKLQSSAFRVETEVRPGVCKNDIGTVALYSHR